MSARERESCITCAGALERMTVLAVDRADGLAECADEHGSASRVEVGLIGEVRPGEVLLVHAGAALARDGDPGAGAPTR